MDRLRTLIVRTLCLAVVLAAGLTGGTASAQRAVPNVWGFAYVNVPFGIPSPSHQAGSWPAASNVTVAPGVAGQVFVRFPTIGTPGGVVHVTAVTPAAAWCQAQRWGQVAADEVVAVRCYRFGGVPAFTPFSITFEQSSGPLPAPRAFGYVHFNGVAVTSRYNSAGGFNTVAAGPPGVWTVTLPGLGSLGRAGNIQVTAVNPAQAARCKVSGWAALPGAQLVQVRCHNAGVLPLVTGWTLTYQRQRAVTGGLNPPRNFAYTFDTLPAVAGPYSPAPPVNFNSQGGLNTIQGAGAGLRLVIFPQVGVLPDNVQVTAFGPGPEYCNLLTLWATFGGNAIVRDVACYSGLVRTSRPSMTTYTSAR